MEPWIDYHLPPELIAQEPLANRADARLMVVDRKTGGIHHHHIRDLPELLHVGDRLVLNDTKVIPAQLKGTREGTGGRWQGLYLGSTEEGDWKLMCKTRGHLQPMEGIMLRDRNGKEALRLWLLERLEDGQWLARPATDASTLEVLEQVGHVPLPPYIRKGNMVDRDVVDYQTVYARTPGAVAAPTAGLHFTKELLEALAQTGVEFSAVTLHVGLGTFRPIATESYLEHPMHAECGELTDTAAAEMNETHRRGGRVIAIGTTVTRLLEMAARDRPEGERQLHRWQGEADLFIHPPYTFRTIDGLLTNFHFPRTTLLLLVQAFAGTELVRQAYEEAVKEQYRFYSYGDAMLVL